MNLIKGQGMTDKQVFTPEQERQIVLFIERSRWSTFDRFVWAFGLGGLTVMAMKVVIVLGMAVYIAFTSPVNRQSSPLPLHYSGAEPALHAGSSPAQRQP